MIEKYGLLRKTFLKENCPNWYQCMLATGKLSYHLAEIDQRANERWEALISHMDRVERATEALKESDPMTWIQLMNSIQNRVSFDKLRIKTNMYIKAFGHPIKKRVSF